MKPGMKIDRIQAFAVGNPWKNWILVKVSTNQGHIGWGEATTGLTTQPAFAAVGEIARLFIGRDPPRSRKTGSRRTRLSISQATAC